MAVCDAFCHRVGVDPGVDHWCRVLSGVLEVRSTVVFEVRDGRSAVVILISRSWLLATNLLGVVLTLMVLEAEERVAG